jgi:hypothetical protein
MTHFRYKESAPTNASTNFTYQQGPSPRDDSKAAVCSETVYEELDNISKVGGGNTQYNMSSYSTFSPYYSEAAPADVHGYIT